MKKYLFAGALALSLTGTGYLAASPYLAAYQLKTAVNNADADSAIAMMDIEAIRHNLRKDLMEIVASEVSPNDSNPFAAIGHQFADNYITSMINILVTPEMIEEIITLKSDKQSEKASKETDDSSLRYLSPNRFMITVTSDDGYPIQLELNRRMAKWKLVKVQIPENHLKKMM